MPPVFPYLLAYLAFFTITESNQSNKSLKELEKILKDLATQIAPENRPSKYEHIPHYSRYDLEQERLNRYGNNRNFENAQSPELLYQLKNKRIQKQLENDLQQALRFESNRICKATGRCGCSGGRCGRPHRTADRTVDDMEQLLKELNNDLNKGQDRNVRGDENKQHKYDDRRQEQHDRRQKFDNKLYRYKQQYNDKQQTYGPGRLEYNDRKQEYDDRRQRQNNRKQEYDDRRQRQKDRRQKYDDKIKEYNDQRQERDNRIQKFDNNRQHRYKQQYNDKQQIYGHGRLQNDRKLEYDDRRQRQNDRKLEYDDRKQKQKDRRQKQDDRRQRQDDRRQDDRRQDDRRQDDRKQDDRRQEYEDRIQEQDGRQQAYDDRTQEQDDRRQEYDGDDNVDQNLKITTKHYKNADIVILEIPESDEFQNRADDVTFIDIRELDLEDLLQKQQTFYEKKEQRLGNLNLEDFVKYYEKVKKVVTNDLLIQIKGLGDSSYLSQLLPYQKKQIEHLKNLQYKTPMADDDLKANIVQLLFGTLSNIKLLPHSKDDQTIYIPEHVHKTIPLYNRNSILRSNKRLFPLTFYQKQRQRNLSPRQIILKHAWRRNNQQTPNYGVPFELKVQGLGQVN